MDPPLPESTHGDPASMKPSKTLLSRLPSVNELLEKPRIKALLDRVNQMEVTTGVRQYIERARHELSRRSLDSPLPSISELVDRAARYILRNRSAEPQRVINATGQYWPPGLVGPPWAEEAILAATEWMQHYHEGGSRDLDEALADGAGSEGALVCNTPSAALWLALAALAGDKPLVIARGELGTLDDGMRITDLGAALGIEIVAVGATDRVTIDDYREVLERQGACVLRVESLPHATWPDATRPTVAEIASVCHARQVALIHYLHNAPLLPLEGDTQPDRATVASSLRGGADVAIVRGDGYIGGPSCGLVVGKRRPIEALREHKLSRLVRVHPSMAAAMAVTMTLLRTADRPVSSLPLLALRGTPIDNLKLRAERIAAQLEAVSTTSDVRAVELPAGQSTTGHRELASWGVKVTFKQEELPRLRQYLAQARPRLEAISLGDELLVDLRTVFPGEDMEIVSLFESFGGVRESEPESTTESTESKETA